MAQDRVFVYCDGCPGYYSGKVMLRIDPGIHAKAAVLAKAEGKSLNAWAQEALQQAIAAQ